MVAAAALTILIAGAALLALRFGAARTGLPSISDLTGWSGFF